MKVCPNCQELLKPDAVQCTHCGHQLAPIPATAESGAQRTPDRQKFGCAVLIIALLALALWAFSSRYLAQSPQAAQAVKAAPGTVSQDDRQGR